MRQSRRAPAHLMVNYDLPWNPNRIEQRFGRIHRIGQTEVCRLWNLVAANTREGEVFGRLLQKVEEQRKAYGGKVFDVLGSAFDETPLRELLIEAIRYGDLAETRARMEQVIDDSVAHGLKELLQERALTHDVMSDADLAQMQRVMEEARARRLQPHYIEWAFRFAFQRLGGRLARRERGRYEIAHVPAAVRAVTKHGPVASRYERVTFELDRVDVPGKPRADLLAPGHPLHDAVAELTITQLRPILERGTVLVSADVEEPNLLAGVVEEVVDGTGASIARRFGYAYVDAAGQVRPAGPAPPRRGGTPPARRDRTDPGAGGRATGPRVEPAHRRGGRGSGKGAGRHQAEGELRQSSPQGAGPPGPAGDPSGATGAAGTAGDQAAAHHDRRAGAAAVHGGDRDRSRRPHPCQGDQGRRAARRGGDLVLATERALGREPRERAFNNPGYDILSLPSDGGPSVRIEVKARIEGAEDFYVTHNEIVTGKNAAPHYRLALVTVSTAGPEYDQVRYIADPFAGVDLGDLAATGVRADWPRTWAAGSGPF
ncbi:DUF3883 domain-containing protein [Microbispora sp. NPDC088329]|uniref:protein NO VEIN domain-containing protein n=1 Tax=Microbispora sp. NPDC088329 TaxID=3154869 RepID=UPI003431698F